MHKSIILMNSIFSPFSVISKSLLLNSKSWRFTLYIFFPEFIYFCSYMGHWIHFEKFCAWYEVKSNLVCMNIPSCPNLLKSVISLLSDFPLLWKSAGHEYMCLAYNSISLIDRSILIPVSWYSFSYYWYYYCGKKKKRYELYSFQLLNAVLLSTWHCCVADL